MDNYEKRNRYALLMKKLDIATKQNFYYESIFIEYAIFEERMDSLMRHGKMKKLQKLHFKINAIKAADWFKDKEVQKYISNKTLDEIIEWKDKRNKLIHDLVNCTYGAEEIESIAKAGEKLVKNFNSKSTAVNKYLDKKMSTIAEDSRFENKFKYKKLKGNI